MKTVLIVDDDRDIADVIVLALASETSYHATSAASAFEALRFIQHFKPNLIILDYMLPDRTGIQVYDQLQTMPEGRGIPVLFLSAHLPRRELEKRALAFLEKPFELDELLQAVRQVLQ